MTTKQDRVDACNKLLTAIGNRGRRFFYHRPMDKESARYARFELRRGAVYFVDDYSGKAIYTAWTRDTWRGFSGGGTLRGVVIKLSEFIRTGSTIAPGNFGPWPSWICGSDLWGYGAAAMQEVRQAALDAGVVAFTDVGAARAWVKGES